MKQTNGPVPTGAFPLQRYMTRKPGSANLSSQELTGVFILWGDTNKAPESTTQLLLKWGLCGFGVSSEKGTHQTNVGNTLCLNWVLCTDYRNYRCGQTSAHDT